MGTTRSLTVFCSILWGGGLQNLLFQSSVNILRCIVMITKFSFVWDLSLEE